jgi:hypothetical protein
MVIESTIKVEAVNIDDERIITAIVRLIKINMIFTEINRSNDLFFDTEENIEYIIEALYKYQERNENHNKVVVLLFEHHLLSINPLLESKESMINSITNEQRIHGRCDIEIVERNIFYERIEMAKQKIK